MGFDDLLQQPPQPKQHQSQVQDMFGFDNFSQQSTQQQPINEAPNINPFNDMFGGNDTNNMNEFGPNSMMNQYAPPSAMGNSSTGFVGTGDSAPAELNRRMSPKVLYQEERLREQIRQAEQREKLAKKQANEQRIENERLERENEQLKLDVNAALQAQAAALKQSQEALSSIQPLRIENEKLKQAVNQWKEMTQTKEAERDSLQVLVNDLLNVQNKEKSSSEENVQNNLKQVNTEQARMIEQYKMNMERFKETVQKLREENDGWKLEKQQLLNQQNKMKKLDNKNAQLLRQYKAENESLKRQNNILADECKEAQMENNELKQQLQQFRQQRIIDPSRFREWSGDEFIEWICSLDKGRFKQYENILSAAFKKQGINGQAIPHIQKNDWMSWGIQNFMDRTNIDQYVQKLIQQQNGNNNDNPFAAPAPAANDDEGAPTAYIQH